MIYEAKLTTLHDRALALSQIQKLKRETPNFTLIDVGANANPWTRDFVTHVIDIEPCSLDVKQFRGNISDVEVWVEVVDHVEKNGKFDFLVSTHTIEDISAAPMVCGMFTRIAKAGFIAVPSKYSELSRHEGPWRGYIHHRWIYDIKHDNLLGYPKQPFVEYMQYMDDWVEKNPKAGREELQFFWKDEIHLNVVNNDHLGPSWAHVVEYYKQLIS
jgi:hypothetical protein